MNQLVSIYHTLVEALDHKKDVRLVFCDISSAFDRVWHRGLLHRLHNIGFQGKLHVWLHDYLSERYQRVVVQGKSSTWSKIFLIYINDLPEIVESNIRLFADDTTFFTVVDDMEESTLTLKGDLSALKYWADQWLVTFNPQKTESLYVTYKTDVSAPTLVFD